MNGAKEIIKVDELLNNFIQQINDAKLTTIEVASLIQQFLYSIGASNANKEFKNSEEVMLEYQGNPTFWNALMAQSLVMKDMWKIKGEEINESKSSNL